MYLKCLKQAPKFLKSCLHNHRRLNSSTSAAHKLLSYSPGQRLNGFVIQQIQEVPELDLTAIRLKHELTDADYLHIDRQDTNNLFSVSFKTIPHDDSGVAHVLEHLALCGSKQYPVRDPFFKMLNRTLSTYMNALTGPDYTQYPFSTQNPQDFKNLMSVYLDCTFFPTLKELDFRQEGWRLEHEEVNDITTPIIFKGVVFNEMKGVYSDPSQIFARHIMSQLFPDLTYRHMSGGDPMFIPNLTYNQLREFHQLHYHPSNARFFSYGDFPLKNHLEILEEQVLSKFSAMNVENEVMDQARWKEPRRSTLFCRNDPMAPNPLKQHTIGVKYLINNITDVSETLTMMILCSLLIDGSNSPFHKALIESGLGSDYSPSTGFSSYTKQSTFSVGLCGLLKDDCSKVEKIIEETFEKVIKEGFPHERVEALLHSIDLGIKHQQTNFGLKLSMGVNKIWNHGGDPIAALQHNKQLDHFKKLYKSDPQFLQKKVEQYFKNNAHKLTVTMEPQADYEENLKQQEQTLLTSFLDKLSDRQKKKLYGNGLQLKEHQLSKEDLSCLPTLKIKDIAPDIIPTEISNQSIVGGAIPVQLCRQPTNGLVYMRILANLESVPDSLKPYLPLFSLLLTNMGAGDMDYRQLDQRADLKTSGLSASLHLSESPFDHLAFNQGILLSSCCLEENKEAMIDLWNDVLMRVTFEDQTRLEQLVKMAVAELSQSLPQSGHHYSVQQACNNITPYGKAQENYSGVSQIIQLKNFTNEFETNDFLSKMKEISRHVFTKQNLKCSLNGSNKNMEESLRLMDDRFSHIPSIEPSVPQSNEFVPSKHQTHFVMPLNVNYVGKAFYTQPLSSDHYSKLKLITKLLTSKFLHAEIREQGGAYGGGASVTKGGLFTFYSYRDPNVSRTINAFEDSIMWLMDGNFTEQDLDEAKLRTIQEIDSPVAPGDKGMKTFLNMITDDLKQTHKLNVLSAKKSELLNTAERFLVNPSVVGLSLIGPETDFTKEWKQLKSE